MSKRQSEYMKDEAAHEAFKAYVENPNDEMFERLHDAIYKDNIVQISSSAFEEITRCANQLMEIFNFAANCDAGMLDKKVGDVFGPEGPRPEYKLLDRNPEGNA